MAISSQSDSTGDERTERIRAVIMDVLERRNRGETVSDESLIARFAHLMPELGRDLALLRLFDDVPSDSAELRDPKSVRGASSGEQAQMPSSGKLHVRCPHCHRQVQVAGDDSFVEITCSGCGSCFSLVADAMDDEHGRTVERLGHLELIRPLGIGGFGTVWMARDTQLERIVAVKIPRHRQLAASEADQFLREARTAALLKHPNIVSVHEVGCHDGCVYIVSDYVQGVTLADWLREQRAANQEAAELCAKIAVALDHAHQAGVVHRDLKPQNIMLDEQGEPHLMDFGLARREFGEVTVTMDGQVLGTPAYMSPEQARGGSHGADRRADIYSLGVILFQLLTGELPFRGSARMLIQHILNDEPPSPRRLNRRVPKDLETICLKCLEKEPAKRFSSAKELAEEFGRFLRDEPIHARPVSSPQRVTRWCRRNPIPATLVLVLLALAVAGPISAVTQTRLRVAADSATATANEERLRADRRAYVSDMNLAAQAWEAGDLTRARNLLARHVPENPESSSTDSPHTNDLRGFEWRLLWGLANDDEGTTFDVPKVACVALSPDAKHLACGAANGSVNIIDVITRQQKTPSKDYSSGISRIAYSNDGRWLAAGCQDGTILLWEVGSWREKAVLTGHTGGIRDLVFHPDAAQLTSMGTDKTIRIWSMTDNGAVQVIAHPEPDAVRMSISADATTLATSGHLDNTVRFWKLRQDSRPRQYQQLSTLPPQQGLILSIALSTDGKKAVISSHDSLVSSWDVATLKPLVTYSQKVLVYDAMFSADGQTLVTAGSDDLVKVWQVESGRELRTLGGPLYQIGLSADGKTLARLGNSDTVTVRSISYSADRNRLLHDGIVVHLAVSPDGQTLATTDPNFRTVKLWDLSTLNSIDLFKGGNCNIAFSPDGKWLALLSYSPNGKLMLWDRSTKPNELKANVDIAAFGVGPHLTFSHSSKILAFRGQRDAMVLWDVAKQEVLGTLPNHTSHSNSAAFAPDEEVLATGSSNQVRLWDVSSQRLLAAIPDQSGDIRSLCFSPTESCSLHPAEAES